MSHLRLIRSPREIIFIEIFILRLPMTTTATTIAAGDTIAPDGNFAFSNCFSANQLPDSSDSYHHNDPCRLSHQFWPVATPTLPPSAFSGDWCLPPRRTQLPAFASTSLKFYSLVHVSWSCPSLCSRPTTCPALLLDLAESTQLNSVDSPRLTWFSIFSTILVIFSNSRTSTLV